MAEPINVGMTFRRKTDGSIWEVVEDRGFGRIEIFNKERCMFALYNKRGIRQHYVLVTATTPSLGDSI